MILDSMSDRIAEIFLQKSGATLTEMSGAIGRCLDKLTNEQIWTRGSADENAIGNLILHICGNARQWIISGVGGREDDRNRDSEFAAAGDVTSSSLRDLLEQTVSQTIAVFGSLKALRLLEIVHVQNREVTVLEAIYHVVGHFQQHTGQIIFATKQMTGKL